MEGGSNRLGRTTRLCWLTWSLGGVWTAALAGVLVWELFDEATHARQVALGMAEAAYERDMLFRQWNIRHGGVFVPSSQDLETPAADSDEAGLRKLNQLGMMREVYGPSAELSQIHSRVVDVDSLNHIGGADANLPGETIPDRWERDALASFLSDPNLRELSSLGEIDGQPHMRLMHPLVIEQAATDNDNSEAKDARVGSLSGGISVSVPMSLVLPTQRAEMVRRMIGYGAIWGMGLLGIAWGSSSLRRQIQRRQKIEDDLRESRFRIRQITANMPGVVYQFLWHPEDQTYSFPFVSRGIERILGMTPEQVYEDPVALFPGMLCEEKLEPLFESTVEAAENETTWHREIRCRTADGEIKWIRVVSRPRRLPDGDVLFDGVFLDITDLKSVESRLKEAHDILEDRVIQRTIELQESNRELQREISERKRAEKWLLKSEEQLRSFFELGVVGMAVTSPERYWEEVNPQLCKMLGYSEHELTRKTWDELTHPDDLGVEEANFERMLSGVLKEYTGDKRFVRKDGQPLYAVITARCVYDSNGEVENLVMLVRDTGPPANAPPPMNLSNQQTPIPPKAR